MFMSGGASMLNLTWFPLIRTIVMVMLLPITTFSNSRRLSTNIAKFLLFLSTAAIGSKRQAVQHSLLPVIHSRASFYFLANSNRSIVLIYKFSDAN